MMMVIVTVDEAPTPPSQKDSEGSEKGEDGDGDVNGGRMATI